MSIMLCLGAGLLVSLEVTSPYWLNTDHGVAIIQIAGSCNNVQVADTWSTPDLTPGTTEPTGSNVSAAAVTSNKALLEAQKKLRISQQQVWHTVS